MKRTLFLLGLLAVLVALQPGPSAAEQTVPRVQGQLVPAAAPETARTWTVERRDAVDFPPMAVQPVSGPLKPRPVTPRDFYLNVVDVSLHQWIIVKFTEEAQVRWHDNAPWSKSGASLADVTAFLDRHPDVVMYPENEKLSEDLLDFWETNGERNTGQDIANLNDFYVFQMRENPDPLSLLKEVIALDIVETAFYAPKAAEACADVAPTTPNFEGNQTYIGAAPDGVDAQFAWSYYGSAGRGNTNAWCIDVEQAWTENHEDFPSDFEILGGGDHGWQGDHGDAVIGIIAACNNGYGMTGLSSNVHPKGVSYPWQTGSTDDERWGNAFTIAASWLQPGESYLIEIHYPGPNPGYACDSVGCGNCSQFSFIAVEYWDNAFAAIQTATANGINVYEAAGNGAMNFDAAVYANRYQTWFRNSGAIVVGASDPATRQAACWSNYGSRIDLFAWGSGVATCGYGTGWSGSTEPDRSQWYRAGFGGTSAATPIVTASGNDLQGIAQAKYGLTLSPAQMHNYLAADATAHTGAHDIGVQPDLADAINAIEPDVAPYLRTGWDRQVVPRNTTGATTESCHLTALTGNANVTWWNAYGRNFGPSPAPDAIGNNVHTRIYLDGDYLWSLDWTRIGSGGEYAGLNIGPNTVRGGRHSVQWAQNPLTAFTESNHNNNTLTQQFVWSPLQMPVLNTILTRSAPPLKAWGNPVHFNGDGFRGYVPGGTTSYWLACAVLPQTGNDIDLYSYADSYTATSGFDTEQKYSNRGSGQTDFVLINGNAAGSMSRLFQAVRYSDASGSDYAVEMDGALTASYYPPYSRTVSLGAYEVMDLYEIWLSAGEIYYLAIENVTGGMDLALNVYGTGGDYYNYLETHRSANVNGANGNEILYWAASTDGWYCAAVLKPGSAGYGVSGSYTFRFESPGVANIVPATTLAGWDAPVVAMNNTDGSATAAHFPAALQGNSITYLNMADGNLGTGQAGAGFNTQIFLDNVLVRNLAHATAVTPWTYTSVNDVNVFSTYGTVRGGRHTLAMTCDNNGLVAESNEGDNSWSGQYVWSPGTLPSTVALVTAAPPNKGTGPFPNAVGYQFTAASNYAAGVAVVPKNSAADDDMYLYSDYTGTHAGYSNAVAISSYGGAAVDYVIVPWRQTAAQTTWYPAVVNYNAGSDSVMVDFQTTVASEIHALPWSTPNPDTIAIAGLWRIYEIPLTAGTTYRFSLDWLSGAANLELRLHRDSTSFQTRPGALAVIDATVNDETLYYAPAVSDWYVLAVGKTTYMSWSQSAIYALSIEGITVPPRAVDDLVIEPVTTGLRLAWDHVSQDTAGNPLTGRRYVVYRSTDINLVPQPADSIGGTTANTYTDSAVVPGARYFYRVRVKAN